MGNVSFTNKLECVLFCGFFGVREVLEDIFLLVMFDPR